MKVKLQTVKKNFSTPMGIQLNQPVNVYSGIYVFPRMFLENSFVFILGIDTTYWTPWLDRDNPSGLGDYELYEAFVNTDGNVSEFKRNI